MADDVDLTQKLYQGTSSMESHEINHFMADYEGHVAVDNGKIRWTKDSVLALMHAYKENMDLFKCSSLKSIQIWKKIKLILESRGHVYTTMQCKNKFANLKRCYVKKKYNTDSTEATALHFEYFEEMEELFAKNHNIEPISLACSSSYMPEDSVNSNQISNEDQANIEKLVGVPVRKKRKRYADAESLQVELMEMRQERKQMNYETTELIKREIQLAEKQMKIQKEAIAIYKNVMEKLLDKL